MRTARFEGGWTLEMSIPFKSLRYPGPGPQVWGLNMRRVVKWKNEYSYVVAMPASFGTGNVIARVGSVATLVGVETPAQSLNLELKPYAVSSVTTDSTAARPFSNETRTAEHAETADQPVGEVLTSAAVPFRSAFHACGAGLERLARNRAWV